MKTIETIALGFLALMIGMLALGGMSTPKLAHAWQQLESSTPQSTSNSDYRSLAREDALDAGIDPTLFVRQIDQESGFNPQALSRAEAQGIAQIMPTTARGWDVDPWDAAQSLRAAAHAMASYVRIYGSYAKAAACYNAGCGALEQAMHACSDYFDCLPTETQNYIVIITGGRP